MRTSVTVVRLCVCVGSLVVSLHGKLSVPVCFTLVFLGFWLADFDKKLSFGDSRLFCSFRPSNGTAIAPYTTCNWYYYYSEVTWSHGALYRARRSATWQGQGIVQSPCVSAECTGSRTKLWSSTFYHTNDRSFSRLVWQSDRLHGLAVVNILMLYLWLHSYSRSHINSDASRRCCIVHASRSVSVKHN